VAHVGAAQVGIFVGAQGDIGSGVVARREGIEGCFRQAVQGVWMKSRNLVLVAMVGRKAATRREGCRRAVLHANFE
jgi:hypothetical protein